MYIYIYVYIYTYIYIFSPPGSSEVKASASNAGDPGLIPGLGRSPGEGNGNPLQYISYQFSSVQSLSHIRLCNPMDCSTPGFLVHHQLLELVQTHVQPVSDGIQASHPLPSPSPPAFNLSQQQSLFQ